MAEHFNNRFNYDYRRGLNKLPFYSDEADYNTNAPSYYDYLAKYNGFISSLVDFVNGLADDIEFMKNNYEALTLTNEEVVYTVGQNGDFNSLNSAFTHIENLIVQPKAINVLILKDYIIREQLFLRNKQYRHITISSESNIVQVDDTHCDDYISINDTDEKHKPIFYGVNCYFPKINIKLQSINAENILSTGFLMDNSTLKFTKNSGAIRFNFVGLFAYNNSNVYANDCDFSYNGIIEQIYGAGIKVQRSNLVALRSIVNKCGEYGFWVQCGSNINVSNSLANGCGHHNLVISQGSTGTARKSDFKNSRDNNVVVTTNSSLDLADTDVSGGVNNNIVVQYNSSCFFMNGVSNDSGISGLNVTKHSFVSAQNAVLKNNKRHGLDSKDGSHVNVLHATIENNEGYGIYCLDGSTVAARSATIEGNKSHGVYCYGGQVDLYKGSSSKNGGSGIRSFNGGRVTADESKINNNKDYGLHASRGEIWASKGVCKDNRLSNSEGKWDISASWGGEITAQEVEVTATGENIRCTSSSIIKASDVKGSAKANKTANEINNQGIIFSNNITAS